ncbi:MAG: hypothetical protein DI595_06585 [Agrobacterium fabrum]|uniref:Uncharacterized protein n=1 Tax=Agrobacterium fabrum TaxID=1176649 RepID=A0A2W5HFP5_9HYPH|nr:MAG: hypothetical protein DI595_06585 [Agrobacterium fabrum]
MSEARADRQGITGIRLDDPGCRVTIKIPIRIFGKRGGEHGPREGLEHDAGFVVAWLMLARLAAYIPDRLLVRQYRR